MILRNPSSAPRIVPYGEARTSADVMASGNPAFRVTQRFADTDRYFGGPHGALDLGNFNCGDVLLSSIAGRVVNKRDIYGALICEIMADSGDVVGYGHLRAYGKTTGYLVGEGVIVGYVGDTGLGGVCHCHFYHRLPNGRLTDPWPELEQNRIAPQGYVRFNAGVDGVNMRRGPNVNHDNVYAVAYADTDPKPNGIHRNGKRLGRTRTRRKLLATVNGPDGQRYFRFRIGPDHPDLYVNTQFMHRSKS